MRSNKILKIVGILTIFLMVVCICTNVFAADEPTDLTGSLNAGGTTQNSPEQTPTEPETNNASSSYEETKIPYAGVESSVLMISAIIVCAMIGIYTFKKSSDYKGI